MGASFNILKDNFNIIFKHSTNVPGLSDSLKHLEGFYNITLISQVAFLKEKMVTSRSKMVDCENPASLLGLDEILDQLNCESLDMISKTNCQYVPVNFNFLVSGTADAHKGSQLVHHLSVNDKVEKLLNGLIEHLLIESSSTEIYEVIDFFKNKGIQTFIFDFTVHHISIISHFLPDKNSYIKDRVKKFAQENFNEKDSKIVLTIHFRQGDTAVFTTADGRLISAWGNWRNPKRLSSDPEVLDDINLAAYKQFQINDFIKVINLIADKANEKNIKMEVNFISDGFGRGIERLRAYSNSLQLSDDDFTYLEYWAKSQEEGYIDCLKQVGFKKNIVINTMIGETKSSFLFSISSIAKTNILIVGVGGFSRTMFEYMGFKESKLLIEEFSDEYLVSKSSDIDKVLEYIKINS